MVKKMFLLVAVFAVLGIAPAAFAQAQFDCSTMQACTVIECPGDFCPALYVEATEAGTAEFTFRAVEGSDCPEGGMTQRGMVDVPEPGAGFLVLRWQQPPPDGFEYSIFWTIGNCTGDNALCGNYTYGTADPDCEDLVAANGGKVSVIKVLPK